MNRLLLFFFAAGVFFHSDAQYCLTGGPSQTIDSNLESLSLVGASGAINYSGCPGVVGVQEFFSQTTSLNAGASYNMSLQFGTCGNNYAGAGQAWIDYNQNFIFEPGESIGTWTGTPPVAISNFLFTVPAAAVNGPTRMRVMQQENAVIPMNPCAAFAWGSVTDFMVTIQGGGGAPTPCYGGPSSTADSNIESMVLMGNGGSSINYTGCPGSTGTVIYSAQTANLGQGMNYTANIQFGTCGGNYGGAGEAWIDYNQNAIFEPSESIGTWQGTPPTPMSNFIFTVPAGALLGNTTMRVVQQEGGVVPPLNPCATFTWGSMSDFSILIEVGIDCSGYVGDDMSDPRIVPGLPFSEVHDNSICYSNQNTVYNSPDVYYLVVPGASVDALEVSLCGSSFDTFLAVLDTQGNAIAINDDHPDCGIQSKLTVNVAAQDSVFVVVDGWGFNSGPYTININEVLAGLTDLGLSDFKLFPNPTTSSFVISNGFSGGLRITDGRGAILFSTPYSNEQIVDVSSFKNGVYFVELSDGIYKSVKKLIIE